MGASAIILEGCSASESCLKKVGSFCHQFYLIGTLEVSPSGSTSMSKYFATSVLNAAASIIETYYDWAKNLGNKRLGFGFMLLPPVVLVSLLFSPSGIKLFSATADTQVVESVEAPQRPPASTPTPVSTPAPVSTPEEHSEVQPVAVAGISDSTCKEYNALGYGNFTPSDPEYTSRRDRDSDGIACEF